jgi:site-specific recombinase XerD
MLDNDASGAPWTAPSGDARGSAADGHDDGQRELPTAMFQLLIFRCWDRIGGTLASDIKEHAMRSALAQVPDRYAGLFAGYASALGRGKLDPDTCRAYQSRVRSFLAWLGPADRRPDPLASRDGRDSASKDYRDYLRDAGRMPRTVNAHLVAIDHLFDHLQLVTAAVPRAHLPRQAPRWLGPPEQDRYLGAVAARPMARDRAIGHLLLRAGVRIDELASLDQADLPAPGRKLAVRAGKGGGRRQVPLLDRAARAAVAEWKQDRAAWPGARDNPALFLNRRGGRLSTRAIAYLVDDLATAAGLADGDGRRDVSAAVLRHTYAVNLVDAGTDITSVADWLGLHRLESARIYFLPAAAAGAPGPSPAAAPGRVG